MTFDEIRSAIARLESDIASGPIVPEVTPQEIRGHLASRYDFTKPAALDDVCADVERMLRTWQVQVTHPRYFGLFNPSVTLASIVADTLVAMYNPQLATWRTSPAANEIERHTLAWLAGKFGLPADAIASFTSGGAEANLSAVIVALTRAFPDYGEGGLRHLASSPTIYVTGEAHHSFNKIAHMTGLGRRALRTVATDRRSEDGSRGSRKTSGRGSSRRVCAIHGGRYGRDHGSRRDRSAAGPGAFLPVGGPVVSRRCGVGRRRHHLATPSRSSRRNRRRRFDHVRRAQMVLGADGRRDVLLPASRRGRRGVPRGDLLHAGKNGRAGRRSVHDVSPVVPAVHRPEALSCARAARRIGVRRNDRAPGSHG